MTYELTTLTIAPGRMNDALALLPERVPADLIGAWGTEFGQVNDVLLLRRRTDDAASSTAKPDTGWLGDMGEWTTHVASESYRLMPFSPVPEPGAYGPLHEMRRYSFRPSALDELLDTWGQFAPRRLAMSPGLLMMHSVDGDPLTVIHMWAYQSLDQRAALRAQAIAGGIWPAPGGARRWLSQENSLLTPLPFSPLN
ncbi:NIPSNAP family protein [Xanthobacter sp. DSM 24535]|uniref:NIPSNAP family protein n=1 Tax=Roseixanthobacter psychrophilus TaxID=3119917 RepID=UPI00372CA373